MKKRNTRAAFALFIMLWSCQGTSNKSNDQSVANGQTLYKAYCVTCHGLQGDMGAAGAANLRQSNLSLEERVVVITKGRNAMQAYEKLLSTQQIEALAKYTAQLQDTIH